MGCDIHGLVQARIDGKWRNISRGWRERNYRVFAVLADVRNGYGFAGTDTGDQFVPIHTEHRGIPDDIGQLPFHEYAAENEGRGDPDGFYFGDHSRTWLMASEIIGADYTRKVKLRGVVEWPVYKEWKGNPCKDFPESWCSAKTGQGLVFIDDELAAPLLKSDELPAPADRLNVRAEWELTYLQALGGTWGPFFDHFVRDLKFLVREYGADNVRFVFGFDS